MVDRKGATHLNISHLTLSATGHFVCKTILYPLNETSRKIIIKKKLFGEMQKRPKIFFYICFRKAHPHHFYLSTDIIDFHKAVGLIYPPLYICYRLHFVRLCIGTINFFYQNFRLTPKCHLVFCSAIFFYYFLCTRINRSSHE